MTLLNHEIGEIVEGQDDIFRVVPFSKYAEMPRLTTLVKKTMGKKFARVIEVERPIATAAMEYAQEALTNSGATGGDADCIVQEYPRTKMDVFIFATKRNGEELFVTAPFRLSNQQISGLTLRGLWAPHRPK